MKNRKHFFRISHNAVEIKLSDCLLQKGDWLDDKDTNLQKIWNKWGGDENSFVDFWDKAELYVFDMIGRKSKISIKTGVAK